MKSIVVASLLTVGALASQAAVAANTVQIKWAGVDTAGVRLSTMDDSVSTSVAATTNYAATGLNYSYVATGESFIAYCIEPEASNGRAGLQRTYSVESFSGTQAQQLQGLFSTSYASLSTYNDKAAFQLAVWELVRETSGTFSVGAGSVRLLDDTAAATAISTLANSFLAQALSYNGSAQYSLTKLTHTGLQDLVVATAVTAVPEPETYALFLAGLGAIGMIARRRLPR